MPTQRRKQRKWIVIAAAVLLTATPSFALFGIGDVVSDPTSYASLIQQLTTLQMQYNMVKNNIAHFSFKQQWQTTLHTLENVNVANMFGETAGIKIALNSNSPSTSATAWKTATVSMNSGANSYLAGRSLGSSRISQLAMVETSDSISADCLTAVGRNHSLNTKLTATEAAAVDAAAESERKAVGEWLRDLVLRELGRGTSQLQYLAAMGEIAALRLLLINTLEPLLRGDKMTADQFKEMLRYVEANKRKAVEDALASYAERSTEQI
jgi:hypothetical protein